MVTDLWTFIMSSLVKIRPKCDLERWPTTNLAKNYPTVTAVITGPWRPLTVSIPILQPSIIPSLVEIRSKSGLQSMPHTYKISWQYPSMSRGNNTFKSYYQPTCAGCASPPSLSGPVGADIASSMFSSSSNISSPSASNSVCGEKLGLKKKWFRDLVQVHAKFQPPSPNRSRVRFRREGQSWLCCLRGLRGSNTEIFLFHFLVV